MAKNESVSMSVIRRLPRYYRFLYDEMQNGAVRISSRELAERMGLTASQIRQDLNCFGEFGQQGYGYSVQTLYKKIGEILGMDELTPAVLVGAGNLGRAVAQHMPFETRGFRIVGVFDDAPQLIGQSLAGNTVRSTDELEALCAERHPVAAVLCIPKESAPALVARLVDAGVKAFWNFSHFDILRVYPQAVVENVHLGDSLMALSYQIAASENE